MNNIYFFHLFTGIYYNAYDEKHPILRHEFFSCESLIIGSLNSVSDTKVCISFQSPYFLEKESTNISNIIGEIIKTNHLVVPSKVEMITHSNKNPCSSYVIGTRFL